MTLIFYTGKLKYPTGKKQDLFFKLSLIDLYWTIHNTLYYEVNKKKHVTTLFPISSPFFYTGIDDRRDMLYDT